jgi:uncharacterized membrane protein YfcA
VPYEPGISSPNRSNPRIDAAIGGVAGLASGLLGVGGGFLMVPLQVMWSRTGQRVASGTSLAAILPIALLGAAVYYFGKGQPQINLTVAFFLVLGSAAGAFGGAHASRRVPENTLKILVAVLLIGVGIKEVHDAVAGGAHSLSGGTGSLDTMQYLVITLCGLVIGILSGLTGVGGGVFLVPTMVLGFGISQRIAQGTSLLAILPTAAVGAFTHHRHGNVDMQAARWIAGAGVPAALLGAALALWLPERVLLGLFGLFLLFAATRMWPRRRAKVAVDSDENGTLPVTGR